MERECPGVRRQSEAATALSGGRGRGGWRTMTGRAKSGVALRLPPQSKTRLSTPTELCHSAQRWRDGGRAQAPPLGERAE